MSPVTGVGTARVWLGAIGLFMLPSGVQAGFTPRSFFDDFPIGRGWIAAEGGSYDEHLVRDVGVLFLALIIVTLWAAWRGESLVPVAVAWLVQGVGHVAYHVSHLDGAADADRVGLVGSLVVIPALATLALGAMVTSPPRSRWLSGCRFGVAWTRPEGCPSRPASRSWTTASWSRPPIEWTGTRASGAATTS